MRLNITKNEAKFLAHKIYLELICAETILRRKEKRTKMFTNKEVAVQDRYVMFLKNLVGKIERKDDVN